MYKRQIAERMKTFREPNASRLGVCVVAVAMRREYRSRDQLTARLSGRGSAQAAVPPGSLCLKRAISV